MKIRQVLFKNFKSYGNNITEINFDDKSSLNLLVGSNGAGKSSIPECITYLLYGQCGYTKAEMVNRYNKKFWGKITLECDGHLIEIERSVSPDTFTASIDGACVDESSKSKLQDTLEAYYKVPYFIFTNLINIDADVSILGMNAANRKKLIDNILNLAVIDEIRKAVKSKLNDADRNLRDKQNELKGVKSILTTLNATSESAEDIDAKILLLEKEVSSYNEKKDKLVQLVAEQESLYNSLNGQVGDKHSDLNDILNDITKGNSELKYSEGILKTIGEHDVCPICGTKSDSADVRKHVQDLEADMAKTKESLKKNAEKYRLTKEACDKLISDCNEAKTTLDKYNNANVSLDALISNKNFEKESLVKRKQEAAEKLESTRLMVESLQGDIDGRLSEDVDRYSSMLSVVDDSNLRQHLTKRYVKYINNAVNQIINVSTYYITFDPTDFSAEIMNAGKKVTFNSLSRGEKRKLDFCVILGLLEVVRSQVGNINLLFLDELFANVDVNSCNDLMDALKIYCSKMPGLQLFVVHHAELNNSVFDNIFEVSKDASNFSVIGLKNI